VNEFLFTPGPSRGGETLREYRPRNDSWWERHGQEVCIVLLIFVAGGIFGFVYEEIFYRINDYIEEGVWHWIKRGSTFGPWIQIYGFGGVFIYLTTKRVRDNPLLVFAISGAVCGALEYLTGLVFDRCFAIRSWDYNVEIWNWGNINGYVCARSVLFFAAAGLSLQYLIDPLLSKLARRIDPKALTAVSVSLASLCAADMVFSTIYDTWIK